MRPNTSVYGMYIPHQAHKKKKKKRRNKMMGTPPLPQNKMIWGALRIGSVLNNACSLYRVLPNRDTTTVTLIAHYLTWRLHLPYLACSGGGTVI